MIDHDAAHQLRGDGKEMGAVLPMRMGLVRELKVSVVEQRGGLQGVAGSLPAHVMVRQTLELRLDERDELLQRADVSAAPIAKELRDCCCGDAGVTMGKPPDGLSVSCERCEPICAGGGGGSHNSLAVSMQLQSQSLVRPS